MARRKPPAIVWREGNLIKIKPINSENIYFTDYSEDIYRLVSGVRWRVVLNGYLQGWVNKRLVLLHHLILQSSAGKAHPFKGGMKGGLAFFLKA